MSDYNPLTTMRAVHLFRTVLFVISDTRNPRKLGFYQKLCKRNTIEEYENIFGKRDEQLFSL